MRARTWRRSEKGGERQAIIVDELPYQVGEAQLLIRIAELVREKRIEGIADLRDETDKSGMRIVIELKRGEVAEIVLNNLYKLTPMQETFGMNMVALVDGQPRLLNLKQFLEAFLRHRREVVTRRTVYDLRKRARARPRAGRPRGGALQRGRGDRHHQGGGHAAGGARPSSWGARGARRWWRRCSSALPPTSSGPRRCRASSAW